MYRNVHRGVLLQKGAGLGSMFGALSRWLIPLIRRGAKVAVRHGSTFAKSKGGQAILKTAKKELSKGGATLAKNVISGKNPKKDVKKDLRRASTNIVNAALNLEQQRRPKGGKRVAKKRRQTGGSGRVVKRRKSSWI